MCVKEKGVMGGKRKETERDGRERKTDEINCCKKIYREI